MEWRERPYLVAPLSEKQHECATCHTIYQGNFCPRCGQSSRVGRYSFKTLFLTFMDEWGLGNRSMFRTIRDLVLRPGYLIRDYLNGMQMAYFPPIRMFFLLTALSIMVTHGLNIKGEQMVEWQLDTSAIETTLDEKLAAQEQATVEQHSSDSKTDVKTKAAFMRIFHFAGNFINRFPSVFGILQLMGVSGFLYLFFRHCPKIPNLRFSEFFISLVYADNMYTIYAIVFGFFGLMNLSMLASILMIIPLKQLSGYSWWQTIWKTVVAYTILFVLMVMIIFLSFLLIFKPNP